MTINDSDVVISPVVLHIPHPSTDIPVDRRGSLLCGLPWDQWSDGLVWVAAEIALPRAIACVARRAEYAGYSRFT